MSLEQTKYSHGRWAEAITFSANLYSALTDGQGRSIPFQLNSQEGGVVRVLLEDAAAYVDMYFNAGDNPNMVIGVDDRGALSINLVAVYPFKPAVITINV